MVVVTNPPFVEYSESDDGEPTRDGALAAKFVRHSLQLGNIVVMLLLSGLPSKRCAMQPSLAAKVV